jgi:complement component 1 Q subcomponent-binding protein, mitochondrial
VFLPSPVDPADQNGEQEGQPEDENRQSQYYIPLMVNIHKGSMSLEISCSSFPNELVIESLTFGPSDEPILSSVEAKLRRIKLVSLCNSFSLLYAAISY